MRTSAVHINYAGTAIATGAGSAPIADLTGTFAIVVPVQFVVRAAVGGPVFLPVVETLPPVSAKPLERPPLA